MAGLSRQRDILPLPALDVHFLSRSTCLSRNSRRRIIRRNHKLSWANDAIHTLNVLGGHSPSAADDHSRISVASAAALEEVRGAFQDLRSPTDPLLTPDGALREFLHSTSVYSQDRFDVKPYSRDLVSWPPVGSKAVSLADGLPEADRSLLADWKTHMLRSTLDSNTLMSDHNMVYDHII